ncbi:thiamine phosphate synthase [Opitutaceae bacterium EW11]|nr:thiamine phosphate synthase [Opitutaceae bacterium EW11]
MSTVDYSVYLVTDEADRYSNSGALLANVKAAVEGGVSMVQYRAPHASGRELHETALALRKLLRPLGVPLIVNDRVDLALAVDADGVHVGQGDLPVAVVRRLLGPGKIVGLSITHESQLEAVSREEVDYLGVGPVYPTGSKSDAAPAMGIDALARIVRRSSLPVVAIGGISLERAPAIFAAGAAGVAVVSAISYATDPSAAARALRACVPGRS